MKDTIWINYDIKKTLFEQVLEKIDCKKHNFVYKNSICTNFDIKKLNLNKFYPNVTVKDLILTSF